MCSLMVALNPFSSPSPGTMTLRINAGAVLDTQSLEMGLGARIETQLAAAGGHGKINVTTTASLDGVLAISLAPGFVALPGSSFQVMTFGDHSGDVTIDNQTGFPGLHFGKSYTTDHLTLTANALGGDADLNGIVDVADLGALASSWQTAGNWMTGDFDASGMVDVADLGILASNWQAGDMSAFGLPLSSVPEPLGLLPASLVLSLMMRRRAQRHVRNTGIRFQ